MPGDAAGTSGGAAPTEARCAASTRDPTEPARNDRRLSEYGRSPASFDFDTPASAWTARDPGRLRVRHAGKIRPDRSPLVSVAEGDRTDRIEIEWTRRAIAGLVQGERSGDADVVRC